MTNIMMDNHTCWQPAPPTLPACPFTEGHDYLRMTERTSQQCVP